MNGYTKAFSAGVVGSIVLLVIFKLIGYLTGAYVGLTWWIPLYWGVITALALAVNEYLEYDDRVRTMTMVIVTMSVISLMRNKPMQLAKEVGWMIILVGLLVSAGLGYAQSYFIINLVEPRL